MSQHVTVHLNSDQRQHLASLIKKGNTPARIQNRVRILLLLDRSQGNQLTQKQVAQATLTDTATVCQISRRFVLEGLNAAISEKPRPGAAPKITGEVEAQLCLLACSNPPEGQAQWTLQLLAEKLISLGLLESISTVAIHQRLKKMPLNLGKSKRGVLAPPLSAS